LLNRLIILILLLSQLSIFADSAHSEFRRIEEKAKTEQNIRDYAISTDGQYLLVVRKQPQVLELLNASDSSLIKVFSIQHIAGQNINIDFVFNAESRQSFIVGMGGSNQLWEVLYEDNPLPVYNGVMHDYRLGEGLVRDQSQFPVRIIKPAGKTNISISSYYFYPVSGLLFIARGKIIEVIQLDARQTIATTMLNEVPDLYSSKVKTIKDSPHLLVPFLNKPGAKLINIRSWVISEVEHY
jgi:hypothetical protein